MQRQIKKVIFLLCSLFFLLGAFLFGPSGLRLSASSFASTGFNYEAKTLPVKQALNNCRRQLKAIKQKLVLLKRKPKTVQVKRALRRLKKQKAWHLNSYRRWRRKLWAKKEIGVFMYDPYTDIPAFEEMTGHKLDVFLWYQSIIEDFNVELANWLYARGIKLELAWEPRDPSGDSINQPEYSLKAIVSGKHDADIRRWAEQIKAFGKPLYFRPMSEMNGNWTSWSGTVNGNQPDDYKAAWRHIYNIFAQAGAVNAQFVWSPNRDGSAEEARTTFVLYYPGDAYVQFVGFNGYNWGALFNTPTWVSVWQWFEEVFGPSYQVATELTKKPIIIAEMASTDVGGSKAQWIQDAFTKIKTKYRRIKTVVWFNVNKETDWRLHSSPESLASFIKFAY